MEPNYLPAGDSRVKYRIARDNRWLNLPKIPSYTGTTDPNKSMMLSWATVYVKDEPQETRKRCAHVDLGVYAPRIRFPKVTETGGSDGSRELSESYEQKEDMVL